MLVYPYIKGLSDKMSRTVALNLGVITPKGVIEHFKRGNVKF